MKEFLGVAADNNWYMEILLGLFCGLREGEILGLKFSDVDFEDSMSIPELEAFVDEVIPTEKIVRFREDLLDIEIDVSEYLPAV